MTSCAKGEPAPAVKPWAPAGGSFSRASKMSDQNRRHLSHKMKPGVRIGAQHVRGGRLETHNCFDHPFAAKKIEFLVCLAYA